MKATGRPKVPAERKRIKPNVTIPACLIEEAKKMAEFRKLDLSRFIEEAVRAQVDLDNKKMPTAGKKPKFYPSTPVLTAVKKTSKKQGNDITRHA